MKRIKFQLLACLCALGLSACGSGSDSESKSTSPLVGQKQGFISIEERANKRVVDAWFSQGVVSELSMVELWSDNTSRCAELTAADFSAHSQANQVGSRWRDTLFAGDFIRLDSRSGEVTRLLAQRYDSSVLYASEERWIAEPLPDDTQLMVTGSDEFPTFDAIPLSPLTRLVRTAPTDGVSNDLSVAISWDVSEATDDAIELTVSAGENTEISTKSVKCWLSDNGQFVLPDVVRNVLPQNRQAIVSLVRVRNAMHESGGAKLHITQTSYP